MKRPTPEQIDVAVQWLIVNEGDEGEAEACGAVAKWLTEMSYEQMLREEARRGGITVASLRRRLGPASPPTDLGEGE